MLYYSRIYIIGDTDIDKTDSSCKCTICHLNQFFGLKFTFKLNV